MPVHARRLIRKMRGGAQAHLLQADDDHFYVVKFRNNPQHRRILVNELIAGVFLRHLRIAAPETAIIHLDEQFLQDHPDVHIQLGTRREPVPAGWHFGSRYPGDPNRMTVYDFIPDALLERVVNRADFLGILVFDKWTANADARQAVFYRARIRDWIPGRAAPCEQAGFVALMVDHGYIFDGPHWSFSDAPVQGLYFRPSVYQSVTSWDSFEPWLERCIHFPEEVVDDAFKQIPREWLNGDEEELERLLTQLLRRRSRIPDLIRDCGRGRANPFPNWR